MHMTMCAIKVIHSKPTSTTNASSKALRLAAKRASVSAAGSSRAARSDDCREAPRHQRFSRPAVAAIRDPSGNLLDPSAIYRVTVNSFMASGGDNFVVRPSGTNRVVGAVDLDALVQYVGSLQQPFTAQIEGRITKLN